MTERPCEIPSGSTWHVRFDPGLAEFSATHEPSSAVVRGTLSFEARPGERTEAWTIAAPRDSATGRLALIDGRDDVQGYLVFGGAGDTLEVTVIHRAAQSYRGLARFDGTATLGAKTFACRTKPSPSSKVVQMASGPADSALNDSLFDPDTDTVLRLSADSASIATCPVAGGIPGFCVTMTTRPEDPAGSTFTFEVVRGYYRVTIQPDPWHV